MLRHIRECPIPAISIEDVCSTRKTQWPTRDRDIVIPAIGGVPRLRSARRIESHVVGNEQIEVPIPVIVQKATTRTPAIRRSGNASLFGDIRECAIAVVVIEHILSEIGNEKIVEAIVIVISNAACLTPSRTSESSLPGDIREGSIAIVMKQIAGGLTISSCGIQAGSVDEEDIEPAVIVVVKERHASAHFLE